MSWNNKVLWSEGVFLQPHHFQQHDRYLEHLIGASSRVATPYPWGVEQLTLDTDLLALGKVALVEAKGLLPDGTPFDLPGNDPPPPALELDETVKDQIVYLTLPLRQSGLVEAGDATATEATLRYRSRTQEVRDSHTGQQQTEAPIEVGGLALRLLLERDDRNGLAHTGLARILECRADKQILLDDAYIPPCVDAKASSRLAGFVGELLGLLHHRGEALAARVSGSGRGGVAEWADFLLLQVINRLEPLAAHLDEMAALHPELLYRLLLPMAGELATFTTRNKRPPEFPTYRHADLAGTFTPVMIALREALSSVLEERAIAIPIQERRFGFRVAPLSDRTLLADAGFILAAHAKVNSEVLRNRFPAQVKVGPVEKIQELVKLALPGIALRPLPVAPRQIPFHSGFVYFELDRNSELWEQLEHSGGFSLHIGGEFPDLELEFWAIRE
ncbi:MAG: type VI secretion system baseplate subunit TssK [Candidatus Thiosymbion ectosymbiont of Robbea hypermnestra]|nr:type VI secretion system baseplate subunit TssK [Candidatus Thiosymbion ectosymbiont of Robbea hypermnestra]